jgi:hypothetical protein
MLQKTFFVITYVDINAKALGMKAGILRFFSGARF